MVSTTGLAAELIFDENRSRHDREYRTDEGMSLLRPDELLQMFGRAGRRGLDDRGYVVVAPKQARMSDARPLKLKRSSTLDWPALIRIMGEAVSDRRNHVEAARWLAHRLFSEQDLRLSFRIPYPIYKVKEPRI